MNRLINKLNICKSTRKIAADSLLTVLKKLLNSNKSISEIDLRDAWIFELRKHKEIFPDGWYTPPPHGIGILFGNDKITSRTHYRNLREEEYTPRNNIFLNNENSLVYAYASPVDKNTGIIGDFGMTLYFDKNKSVQNHLKQCLLIDYEIFQKIEVGISFSDIYKLSEKIFKEYNLSNEIISKTDTAVFNIGHTIPSFDDFLPEEKEAIKRNNWLEIKNTISKKRKFINETEQETLEPGMAITMEPRLTLAGNPDIPMASYHTIILIKENREKELLTGFDEIFKAVGMNCMLD